MSVKTSKKRKKKQKIDTVVWYKDITITNYGLRCRYQSWALNLLLYLNYRVMLFLARQTLFSLYLIWTLNIANSFFYSITIFYYLPLTKTVSKTEMQTKTTTILCATQLFYTTQATKYADIITNQHQTTSNTKLFYRQLSKPGRRRPL